MASSTTPVPSAAPRYPAATAWFLALAVAVLRLAAIAPDFGGVSPDTGNYLLGMQHYAPELARPHLPGSWLMVALLRLLSPLAGGGHGALLLLAVGGSAAAAGLAWVLLRRWFAPGEAWLLAAVLATQPVVWFYGTVAEVYSLDLLFGMLVVHLGLTRRGLLILPLVFALGVGLRPTTPVLLLPLYAHLWWRGRHQWGGWSVVASHLAAALVLVLAFGPTVAQNGGPDAYFALYREHLPADWSPLRNLWGMALFLATLAVTALVLVLARFGPRQLARPGPGPADRRLLLFWLLPPGLFFLLGHYQKGYALLIVAPLLVLLLAGVPRGRRRGLLTGLVLAQALFFLAMPQRLPALDVLVAPAVRAASLPEVWWQRVRSTHLMAAARPRALAAVDRELAAVLVAAPADTLLIDPTFPLFLRAVQVRHPERAFAALELGRPDGWTLHAGLAERPGDGVADLLERTVLVTRGDFAAREAVFADAAVVQRGDHLVALRIPPERSAVVAARYAELFRR